MRFSRSARSARFALSLALLAAVAACGDSTAPSATLRAPSAPTAIISDGSRTGGNPDFFFLPPVVGNPSSDPDFSAGQFNGGWKPVVDVCEVAASNLAAGCVSGTVRTYAGAAIAVSTEQYQLHVDTRESWAVAGKTYRFTVTVVGTQPVSLGFVDIALLAGSAKNVNTGDVVAMHDGRTIPLKFRIENGATVPSGVSVFSETVVTDAGATVLTGGTGAPGTFALRFPADWLPPELGQVQIVVERLSTGPGGGCLTSVPNLLQTSDCWRVTSYPEIPRVTQDLTVAFCPAIPQTDPRYDAQAMFKFDAPARLEQLESVPTTLVNCDASGQIGAVPRQPGVMGALHYGLASLGRGLSRAFGPNTAYAVDLGWGGRLVATDEEVPGGVFSEFFWGIPLRLDVIGDATRTGAPGDAVAALTARVTGTHTDGDISLPIPGVTVRFLASAGTLGGGTAITNADGVATMPWTLGTTTGPQSVSASITSIGVDTAVTFTATAQSPLQILINAVDITGTTQVVSSTFSGTLTTAGGPPTAGCSYATSNSSIVNVDGAFVVATGTGTAIVTVTCGSATATVTFTVQAPATVSILRGTENIAGTTQNVTVGYTTNVMITNGVPNAECGFTTSNSSVVNVDGSLIVATGAGTAVLTAFCSGVEASVTFTVSAPAASIVVTDTLTGTAPPSAFGMGTSTLRTFRWQAVGFTNLTSCQIASSDIPTLYAYGSNDGQGNTYINLAARRTGEVTVSITCADVVQSYAVTVDPLPVNVAARCVNGPHQPYAVGDQLFRGFYLSYPNTQLTGADLYLGANAAGTYTVALTARAGSYTGPVLAADTVEVALGLTPSKTLGAFRWPAAPVTANTNVMFSLTQVSGPGTAFYSVYNSFANSGDQSCPITQTDGSTGATGAMQFRRFGVEAILYYESQ